MKNSQIHSAVILTAGIGKRLQPLTNHVHKALLPVKNQPALQLIIDKLKAVSVDNFYFNTFHLADQIAEFLENQHDLNKTIVREQTLRNTGGGIANFRNILQNETFILHNCDVYSEEDLQNLIDFHYESNNIATLMVVDYPEINSVRIENNEIQNLRSNDGNCTYCGIAVFSPDIWKYFPDNEVFSIVPVLESAMKNGERIGAYLTKAYWNDFGTPERYQKLQRYLDIVERKSLLKQP
ncbi:MAG: NTP transferase domain-containing protein [Calditrichaeota bacterium]|nr:NTP transferase domain-containing protein [Calditrichota bacterium]